MREPPVIAPFCLKRIYPSSRELRIKNLCDVTGSDNRERGTSAKTRILLLIPMKKFWSNNRVVSAVYKSFDAISGAASRG